MSWPELVKSKMQITTGDGKTFEVLYLLDSVKGSFEYNVSEFHFPEVSGTKVDRRLRKGKRYQLEFYFQGDDHIDQWKEFDNSCTDKRSWGVLHPFYGLISGEPISIGFDSSGLNVTKVEVTFVESIQQAGPRNVSSPSDNSKKAVSKARDVNNTFFLAQVKPTANDVSKMKQNVNDAYSIGSAIVTVNDIASQYFNLYQTALKYLNTALSDATIGINFVQDFLTYPASFYLTVKERLKLLQDQFNKLGEQFENLLTPNEKKIYENQQSSIVTAIIETVLTPLQGDYTNSVDVIGAIEGVLSVYNELIKQIQELQTPTGMDEDSYLPDSELIESLNFAVNYAISNLFEIALRAKQERVIYLEEDSNIILLAHRFYGLLPDDSTINYFVDTNNIGISETLMVEKGRRLVYYV